MKTNIGSNLESVACDFCGSNNHRLLFKQRDSWIQDYFPFDYEFKIVKCKECGLCFVNPRPSRAFITNFYPSNYHDERVPEQMAKRYERQIRFVPPIFAGQRVLDVGCARGDFLHWLQKQYPHGYFTPFGCDAYSGGVREGYRVSFTGKELPECGYESDYFDHITSWAVLEHVHNPGAYFQEIARTLKPGGSFTFLVPNFNSLMCRAARNDDIARHIYQFTRQSLDNYLSGNGFKYSITTTDDIFDGRGFGSISKLITSNNILLKKLAVRIDHLIFTLNWEAFLGIGGMFVVRCRKQGQLQGEKQC